MAITTGDQLVAANAAANAAGNRTRITKTNSFTTVTSQWFSTLDVAGQPGAGTLNIGNTANGIVPTDAVAGYPAIAPFAGGATGYLTRASWRNNNTCTMQLYDRLFNVGSISATALVTTALTAQPSYLARTPSGTGLGCEIWLEINTTFSATATNVTVTYTNETGTAGRTTGASPSLSGFTNRRLLQLPLQTGDRGVRTIESVTVGGTVATAGTFNIVVGRTLFDAARVNSANDALATGWDMTTMPEVWTDSALWLMVATDGTSLGNPEFGFTIASG